MALCVAVRIFSCAYISASTISATTNEGAAKSFKSSANNASFFIRFYRVLIVIFVWHMCLDILEAVLAGFSSLSLYFKSSCGMFLWILASAFVVFVCYRLVVALWLSPLRHIPGPFIARLTSKRAEMYTMAGRMSYMARIDGENYGDIYMCTPNGVAIGNPTDVRNLLSNPGVVKADYYKVLRFTGLESTVSARDPDFASLRRRQIGPYFNPSYLGKMEQSIMEHGILSIKRKWDELIDSSENGVAEVNYCEDFLFVSFDIIGTLIFGKQIEELSVNDAATSRWVASTILYIGIRSMLQLLPAYLFSFALRPIETRYQKLSSYIKESIANRRQLAASAEDQVHNKRPSDLVQAFIDAEDPESKVRMTPEQVHSECVLMMMAGSDTVSGTITWTVHLLMLYPKHYKRAVSEVRLAFGKGHLITYADCRAHLPFVEACLFESLRLSPATGGLLPRVSPPGGTTVQGHYIPEGTLIFMNIGAANRNPAVWPNPHLFDPDRFIDNDDARHSILTFSSGKRVCPGKNLAWWEMLTILANILKDYDWALPDDYKRLGPNVIDKRYGYPKQMDEKQFIIIKPADHGRDCRLMVSKHYK